MLDNTTMKFSPGPKMSSPRRWCNAFKLDSNRVLVVGSENGRASTTEILNITSADITSWSFVPGGPTMSLEREGVISVVPLHNSAHFLFFGGSDA